MHKDNLSTSKKKPPCLACSYIHECHVYRLLKDRHEFSDEIPALYGNISHSLADKRKHRTYNQPDRGVISYTHIKKEESIQQHEIFCGCLFKTRNYLMTKLPTIETIKEYIRNNVTPFVVIKDNKKSMNWNDLKNIPIQHDSIYVYTVLHEYIIYRNKMKALIEYLTDEHDISIKPLWQMIFSYSTNALNENQNIPSNPYASELYYKFIDSLLDTSAKNNQQYSQLKLNFDYNYVDIFRIIYDKFKPMILKNNRANDLHKSFMVMPSMVYKNMISKIVFDYNKKPDINMLKSHIEFNILYRIYNFFDQNAKIIESFSNQFDTKWFSDKLAKSLFQDTINLKSDQKLINTIIKLGIITKKDMLQIMLLNNYNIRYADLRLYNNGNELSAKLKLSVYEMLIRLLTIEELQEIFVNLCKSNGNGSFLMIALLMIIYKRNAKEYINRLLYQEINMTKLKNTSLSVVTLLTTHYTKIEFNEIRFAWLIDYGIFTDVEHDVFVKFIKYLYEKRKICKTQEYKLLSLIRKIHGLPIKYRVYMLY